MTPRLRINSWGMLDPSSQSWGIRQIFYCKTTSSGQKAATLVVWSIQLFLCHHWCLSATVPVSSSHPASSTACQKHWHVPLRDDWRDEGRGKEVGRNSLRYDRWLNYCSLCNLTRGWCVHSRVLLEHLELTAARTARATTEDTVILWQENASAHLDMWETGKNQNCKAFTFNHQLAIFISLLGQSYSQKRGVMLLLLQLGSSF